MDQRPIVVIKWSGSPCWADVVAALMRKLWPEKDLVNPAADRLDCIMFDSSARVSG